jgi:hypothetical protein
MRSTNLNESTVINSTANLYDDDNIETAPHSDFIILIARGVGLLVAIAAVIFLILILVFVRATLSLIILKIGILGTCILAFSLTWGIIKYSKIPIKNFSTMVLRACH